MLYNGSVLCAIAPYAKDPRPSGGASGGGSVSRSNNVILTESFIAAIPQGMKHVFFWTPYIFDESVFVEEMKDAYSIPYEMAIRNPKMLLNLDQLQAQPTTINTAKIQHPYQFHSDEYAAPTVRELRMFHSAYYTCSLYGKVWAKISPECMSLIFRPDTEDKTYVGYYGLFTFDTGVGYGQKLPDNSF